MISENLDNATNFFHKLCKDDFLSVAVPQTGYCVNDNNQSNSDDLTPAPVNLPKGKFLKPCYFVLDN